MIYGTLDRLHLGDLVQWLQMGGLTGRLTLTNGRCERRLDFLDGRVVYASSSAPDERLASWLAAAGVLPAEHLRRLLNLSILRRTVFTDAVLAEGDVTTDDLRESLTEIAETITSRALAASRMRFELDPSYPVRDLLGLNIDVEPNALIMEAARLRDEADPDLEEGGEAWSLPFRGEEFEAFFRELVQEGIPASEPADGDQLVALHSVVRDIMATLAQWLSTSPGLVPLPAGQAATIAQQLGAGESPDLVHAPHAVWNQMVLSCTVRHADLEVPSALEAVRSGADGELWIEMTTGERWRRPHAGRLDELTQSVASTWSKTSAAAAGALDVDPDHARLAALMMCVPSDLVLWVLSTLPVDHVRMRHALLRNLPRRIGSGLARRAGFPDEIREVFEAERVTALGASLHLGRSVLPSAPFWPATIPEDPSCLAGVISPADLARALAAVREVEENQQEAAAATG